MYICVTHVDARTGIPCTVAPMGHGPAFPKVKGLQIVWANQTEWPTDKPLFYGTCDDDADVSIPGVIQASIPEDRYLSMRETENGIKEMQVRNERDFRLRNDVDSLNPIRWGMLSEEQKTAWGTYRQDLLDIPQQTGFPWKITWPTKPE